MKKNVLLLALIASLATHAQNEILIPFRVGNKWGYSDTLGKLKIPARYDRADIFNYEYFLHNRNLYATVRLGENMAVVNQKGKQVFSGPYKTISVVYKDDADYFIVTTKGGKSGLRSVKGQVIPAVYDEIFEANDTSFIARKKDIDVLYNLSGKIIFQKKQEEEWMMKEDIGIAALDESASSYNPEDNRRDFEKRIVQAFSAEKVERIDSITYNGTANLVLKGNEQAIVFPHYYYYRSTTTFFSRNVKVKRVIINTDNSLDLNTYKTRAFIIADSAGKLGVMNDQGVFIFRPEYDNITHKPEWGMLDLEIKRRHGIFIFNTIYPPILPAYDAVLERVWIPATSSWNYGLFKVKKNGKEIYVGENRVEFYKNQ